MRTQDDDRIFIDTSFFFAIFSARDRRHAEAMGCLALIRKKTHHALTVAGEGQKGIH